MKLKDILVLDGEREEITMTELRAQPGEVIEQTMLGKTFIVTKNGRPVVEITKVGPTAFELGAEVRRLILAERLVDIKD